MSRGEAPTGGHAGAGERPLALILAGVLVLGVAASLFIGRLELSPGELAQSAAAWWSGAALPPELASKALVFWLVRLPRLLTALLVGAGLAVAGATYQALFRNPLASPEILGVAAGCAAGAALALVLPAAGFTVVRLLALAGGLAAVAATMALARLVAVRPVLVLVLAGLVVTSLCNAVIMILKYLADPFNQLPAIVFWLMGSLARATWADLLPLAPLVGGGVLVVHGLRYRLNVLSLGDRQAKSLGLSPAWHRAWLITVSSLMVALSVATCGQVAWLGLVIPHIARTLVGPNHERMIPVTALCGALFFLLCDDLARSLTTVELPVGVVTSLIGGPLFAWLLYRNRGSGWL
ncbi:MAG: iron ABC transporter permease [Deltaproteobacteria bacterium]|nr:iron ABC transporter permease [Deltaproteobacteria bacterium]